VRGRPRIDRHAADRIARKADVARHALRRGRGTVLVLGP
jgi:hypothetical protein